MAGKAFSLFVGVVLFQVISVLGSKCNWHYYKHYEQKGCTPVLGEDGCPVRYHCKKLPPQDPKTCIHNGKVYRDREPIQDVGPCDSCWCEVDANGSAYIECASVDCHKWEPDNEACYMGYEPGKCCPREICPGDKESGITCTDVQIYTKTYKFGDFMETDGPCESCLCTEDGRKCTPVNCLTGIDAREIRKGCLPIYASTLCCAVQMYCDKLYNVTPEHVVKDESKDDYCTYQGAFYRRGTTTYIKANSHMCLKCTCSTPPDFTCLKIPCS